MADKRKCANCCYYTGDRNVFLGIFGDSLTAECSHKATGIFDSSKTTFSGGYCKNYAPTDEQRRAEQKEEEKQRRRAEEEREREESYRNLFSHESSSNSGSSSSSSYESYDDDDFDDFEDDNSEPAIDEDEYYKSGIAAFNKGDYKKAIWHFIAIPKYKGTAAYMRKISDAVFYEYKNYPNSASIEELNHAISVIEYLKEDRFVELRKKLETRLFRLEKEEAERQKQEKVAKMLIKHKATVETKQINEIDEAFKDIADLDDPNINKLRDDLKNRRAYLVKHKKTIKGVVILSVLAGIVLSIVIPVVISNNAKKRAHEEEIQEEIDNIYYNLNKKFYTYQTYNSSGYYDCDTYYFTEKKVVNGKFNTKDMELTQTTNGTCDIYYDEYSKHFKLFIDLTSKQYTYTLSNDRYSFTNASGKTYTLDTRLRV